MIGGSFAGTSVQLLTGIGIVGALITLAIAYRIQRNDHRVMTDREALNRTLNVIPAAFLVIVGFDLVPDLVVESAWTHRLDEFAFFALAVFAGGWYLRGRNRFRRSAVLLWALAASLGAELIAIAIEHADADDVQADIVLVEVITPLLLLLIWLYRGQRQVEADASSGADSGSEG